MKPTSPEIATLLETLLLRIPLPYVGTCIVLGYLVNTFFPVILVDIVEPGSVSDLLLATLSPLTLVNSLFVSYMLFAPRYMRLRILKSEKQLSQLLPAGEEDFHRIFGRVSSLRPQLLIWGFATVLLLVDFNIIPLLLPAAASGRSSGPQPTTPLGSGVAESAGILDFLVTTLVISSLAWVYYSSLKGIDKLGSLAINFSPFYRDTFLGLRPVGSLALSLAFAYFGLDVFFIVTGFASSPSLVDIVTVGGLLVGLVVVGVLAFFLPLRRLHGRMLQQKAFERSRLSERFAKVIETASQGQDPGTDALEVLKLDLMDRKVSSIATWPFDYQILGKLTIIVLSVTAAMLTRFIALFLRL